ncbi:MAG TPA: RNA-binding S4 domain-containing protein [Acidobacteriaceae bacterium]
MKARLSIGPTSLFQLDSTGRLEAAQRSPRLYDNGAMTGVRADKWLWAARFFKTRALAARACDLGRIVSNGHQAKPSREIHTGDHLHIRTEAGDFHVEVRELSEIRGPAAVAQTLYHETDESRDLRLKLVEERRAAMQQGLLHEGKPSRRDRQQLNRLRGRF